MTIQNLLDMTSSIAWHEKAYTPNETIIQMYKSSDPTEFVLDQPMANVPGTNFYYNSGDGHLPGCVRSIFPFCPTMWSQVIFVEWLDQCPVSVQLGLACSSCCGW